MLQLRRAFRYVAQFWLRMFLPPVSRLHTRATRENTLLPQLMYSTAVSRKKKKTYLPMSYEPTKSGSAEEMKTDGEIREKIK
jgi:hypothetical protein